MERRKYLGRAYKDYFKSFSSETIRIDKNSLKGYAAFTEIKEVTRPLISGDTCLYDNGYSEITYIPDDEKWRMSVLYDQNGDVVEWYVDIVRKNAVDEEGNPYSDDLYLDAALMPDGSILIFDEDELKDALEQGSITKADYLMAYEVLNSLKENKILDLAFMQSLCSILQSCFHAKPEL